MLTVTLRQLELADFGDSNVIRRGKYAELCELSLKSYEMKIKPVSWLKTQMQCETFAKKWKKILTWIGDSLFLWIMPKIWENALIRLDKQFLEYFRTVRET